MLRGVDDEPGVRALDSPRIDGPIPDMMMAAIRWVARMTPTAIVGTRSGHVANQARWPTDAVRELVGNALLHRDLSWSVNEPVVLTLTDDMFVIRNPGGLYGISVGELGTRGVTPARNATLMSIAAHVSLPGGDRAVEQLATGIPTVRSSFANRGYPDPQFVDDAIRFTVIARRATEERRALPPAARRVLDALGSGERTVEELANDLGRSNQVIRRDLNRLADEGLVAIDGGRGRHTTYRRIDP